MLKFSTTKQFEKGVLKSHKQGKKLAKLREIMMKLRPGENLDPKGSYKNNFYNSRGEMRFRS